MSTSLLLSRVLVLSILAELFLIDHSLDGTASYSQLSSIHYYLKIGIFLFMFLYVVIKICKRKIPISLGTRSALLSAMNLWYLSILCVLFSFSCYRFYYYRNIQELTLGASIIAAYCYISDSEFTINEIYYLSVAILASCIIQTALFSEIGKRLIISYGDPNITGYFLLLLYFLFDKVDSKLKYVVLIMGFATLSRGFLFSYMIFFSQRHIPGLNDGLYKLIGNKIWIIVFAMLALIGMVSYSFTNSHVDYKEVLNSTKRLTTIKDDSNEARMRANVEFFNELINNPSFRRMGEPSVPEYTKRIFINIPHNAFFDTIRIKGLYLGGVIILLYVDLLKHLTSRKNLAYVPAILFYQNILVLPIYSTYLIFILFVLKRIPPGRKEHLA